MRYRAESATLSARPPPQLPPCDVRAANGRPVAWRDPLTESPSLSHSRARASASKDNQERFAHHFCEGRVPRCSDTSKGGSSPCSPCPALKAAGQDRHRVFRRECGTGLRVAPVPPRRAALLTRPPCRGLA